MPELNLAEGTTVLQERDGNLQPQDSFIEFENSDGSLNVFTTQDELVFEYEFEDNKARLSKELDQLDNNGFHIAITWDSNDEISWMVNGDRESQSV